MGSTYDGHTNASFVNPVQIFQDSGPDDPPGTVAIASNMASHAPGGPTLPPNQSRNAGKVHPEPSVQNTESQPQGPIWDSNRFDSPALILHPWSEQQ